MSRNTIAVCLVKMEESVQSESIKAITKRAEERGLNVEIYNSFVELVNRDLHDKGEESIFELIDYRHLCGIIYFPEKIKNSRVNENIVRYGREHNLPVVSIDRNVPECISITFDYSKAFEEIVEHLIVKHACKRFFMMAGIKNNSFSDERIEAAKKIINRFQCELTDDYIAYGDFWEGPARTEINAFLDSGKPLPDAFLAANDVMAMVICDELGKRGIQVPEDVIVTGFDGIEMEKYATPRLTTAETDLQRSGALAVDSILSYMKMGRADLSHYVVPFHTRYSQSCGCNDIVPSGANGMVQAIYSKLSRTRLVVNNMSFMLNDMSAKTDFLSMIKEIATYRVYIDAYEDIYICIKKDLAMIDPELSGKLVIPEELKNTSEDGTADNQMVLLCKSTRYQDPKYPLEVFRMREMLPGRGEILDNARNMVFLPLHILDKVYGYVAVSIMPQNNEYDYSELSYFTRDLSQAIAYVTQTINMQRANDSIRIANEKLESLYITDYLTGINNRRGFFKGIEEKKKNADFSAFLIASIDLNGLKYINDKYGHHEGDRAICQVADLLKEISDENSICARFGGDEFAFCKFIERPEAFEDEDFCNNFGRLVARENESGKMPYLFSASCGAVVVPMDCIDVLDKVINQADEKMYAEKALFHRTHKEYEKRRADRNNE